MTNEELAALNAGNGEQLTNEELAAIANDAALENEEQLTPEELAGIENNANVANGVLPETPQQGGYRPKFDGRRNKTFVSLQSGGGKTKRKGIKKGKTAQKNGNLENKLKKRKSYRAVYNEDDNVPKVKKSKAMKRFNKSEPKSRTSDASLFFQEPIEKRKIEQSGGSTKTNGLFDFFFG